MDGALIQRVQLSDNVKLNVSDDVIKRNILHNIELGLPQIEAYQPNSRPVALVGGGSSLNQTLDELDRCVAEGHSVVALNGAAQWLHARGYPVHAHFVLDARPFNVRFVQPAIAGKYFIGSQADPSILAALKEQQKAVWLFHGGTVKDFTDDLDRVYGEGRYIIIKAGSTVMLSALSVLRVLGFYRFEIFGFDSCLLDGHHAYEQPENDSAKRLLLKAGGKVFELHAWMAGQAEDFCKFTKKFGNLFDIVVHGDGLIAHLIKTMAETGKFNIEEISEDEIWLPQRGACTARPRAE